MFGSVENNICSILNHQNRDDVTRKQNIDRKIVKTFFSLGCFKNEDYFRVVKRLANNIDVAFFMIKNTIIFTVLCMFLISCEQNLQQPVFEYSQNNTTETGSRFPNLYKDSTGNIYMSWLANIEEEIYTLQFAEYNNERWNIPTTVDVATDFFVNWADFPSIVGYDGIPLALHRLKKIEGGPYAYNVELFFKDPETERWDQTVIPHLDETATEHGFVSIEPIDDTRVLAVWLDGRNTEGRAHDEYGDTTKAMTLRSAEISTSGEITRSREIDAMVCDCCQTDLAKTDNGYSVVYRARNANEQRDIKISSYNIETGEWSEPVYVHEDGWEIAACPVNGPRIAVKGGNVAVTWYTESGGDSSVQLAQSTDGGQTFTQPVQISDAEFNTLGRVDLLLTEEGETYVSWLQEEAEYGYIIISKVSPSGELLAHRHVGTTSATRSSGFPRIIQAENDIIAAWTQTQPFYRVRTAKIPLDVFNQQPE